MTVYETTVNQFDRTSFVDKKGIRQVAAVFTLMFLSIRINMEISDS